MITEEVKVACYSTCVSKVLMHKQNSLQGEPFTQDELDELLSTAVDSDTGNIHYEYYLNQIMVSSTM